MPEVSQDLRETARNDLRLPLPRLAEISFCTNGSEIVVLTDESLFKACGTRIAFTQRFGGESEAPFHSLNLSDAVGDEPDVVSSNRAALCLALGCPVETDHLIIPKQVHGDLVLELDTVSECQEKARKGADGIVCTQDDVPVLLCFADCVPIVLVAPDGSFAVLHSGWRGTIASIAAIGLKKLAQATGCAPGEVNCYIGPHIGACCYEVSDDLITRFVREFGFACDAGSNHLDLAAAVTAALLRAGAQQDRVFAAQQCTSCRNDLYYSYRADKGVTGRHGAFAIRKGES